MFDARLIQTDSYDREAFERASQRLEGYAALREQGERLLPHFGALVEDLFALLFKLVVRVRATQEAPAATRLNRRILLAAMGADGFAALKDETALDAARSAHATADLARRALSLVKTGELFTEEELLASMELAHEEERLARIRAAAADLGRESKALARTFERGIGDGERRVRGLSQALDASLSELPPRFDAELANLAGRLGDDLGRLDEAAGAFARSMGAPAPRGAGERLALAQKLEKSQKLQQLAKMVGAFRAEARAARRRRRERAVAEVYRVGRGADLGRILPVELSVLRHRARKRDFLRRLLEGELAQYDLRGDDRHGRGPVIVCLDGSGSMSGPRELWAKAVALSLLDVARKQGRRTRALVFSGREAELASFDLTGKGRLTGRRPVDLEQVVRLAECFPGGGTDFEKPLRAALEAVQTTPLRGADIVFITDGEATVSDAFAEELRREKKKRDFAVFAVLVDDPSRNAPVDQGVLSRAARELGKVADRMTTVAELTSKSARELFRAI
jgi:uncharacterized protein with von Willebrand factor type A (vWA) domain